MSASNPENAQQPYKAGTLVGRGSDSPFIAVLWTTETVCTVSHHEISQPACHRSSWTLQSTSATRLQCNNTFSPTGNCCPQNSCNYFWLIDVLYNKVIYTPLAATPHTPEKRILVPLNIIKLMNGLNTSYLYLTHQRSKDQPVWWFIQETNAAQHSTNALKNKGGNKIQNTKT